MPKFFKEPNLDSNGLKDKNETSICVSVDEYINEKPLPLWRKLAFGAGGFPMQMMQSVIGFFLPLFIMETVNLSPISLLVIILSARISDAVTDPLMGLLLLKTNTRFGQKRPWILLSTPVFVTSFFASFYAVNWSDMQKLTFYSIMIVVLQLGLTSFHIPYSSLTMVLSHVPKEREILTAFRMFSEVLAILLGAIVFGVFIKPYRLPKVCITPQSLDAVPVNASVGSTVVTALVTASTPPIYNEEKELLIRAYKVGAAAICAISAVAALVCFFGTRELGPTNSPTVDANVAKNDAGATIESNGDLEDDAKMNAAEFLTAARSILTFTPYLHLMGAFLFMSLAIQFLQGNISLYITHSLKLGEHFTSGIACLLGVTILLVPFAQFLLRRIGKKTTMAIGIVNAFPLLITIYFVPEKPSLVIFYGMMAWAAVTIAIAMLLPWSMLPDVIDAYWIEHNVRLESVFYSVIVFFNKFAVGISLAISAGIIDWAGYNSRIDACIQSPKVGQTLRLLSSVAPIGLLVPALIFLYFYPLGHQQLIEMRARMIFPSSNTSKQDIRDTESAINLAPSTEPL